MTNQEIDATSTCTPVLDRKVFFTSIGVVFAVSLLMILLPVESAGIVQAAMEFITDKFSWMQ